MWHPTATLKDAGPWRNDRAQLSPQVLVLDRLLLLGLWVEPGRMMENRTQTRKGTEMAFLGGRL